MSQGALEDAPDAEGDDADDPEPVGDPSYRPAPIAAGASVVGALAATGATATASPAGAAVASLGLAVLVAGVVRGWRRPVAIGAGVTFAGVLLAGVEGAPVLPVLVGTVGAAVAYDAGGYAVTLGEQVRADGDSTRAELSHVGATTVVAAGAAGVGSLAYSLGGGGQPVTALVALLLAAVFLTLALR